MGFNNGKEKRLFELRWKKLKDEYQKLNMSEENIQNIYEFDLKEFNSNRKYYRYLTSNKQNELFLKNISGNFANEIVCNIDKNDWIENISDERLYHKLKLLSREEIKILTLHIICGYNQCEIAQKIGCSQNKIYKKLIKIKNFEI